MGRLIEVQQGDEMPASVRIRVGDALLIGGSGGRVGAGGDIVEVVGAFLPATFSERGEVVAPMGAPSVVLFLALVAGAARLDVITGDPWSGAHTRSIGVHVDP
jgi:hypothetical protein